MGRQHIAVATKHLLDRSHGTIEENKGCLENLASLSYEAQVPLPPKQPTEYSSCKTFSYPTRIHSARSQIRRLTEFIAPRESKGVRDCKN